MPRRRRSWRRDCRNRHLRRGVLFTRSRVGRSGATPLAETGPLASVRNESGTGTRVLFVLGHAASAFPWSSAEKVSRALQELAGNAWKRRLNRPRTAKVGDSRLRKTRSSAICRDLVEPQELAAARSWRFESSLPHQSPKPREDGVSSQFGGCGSPTSAVALGARLCELCARWVTRGPGDCPDRAGGV